jgi:hypothetical protein
MVSVGCSITMELVQPYRHVARTDDAKDRQCHVIWDFEKLTDGRVLALARAARVDSARRAAQVCVAQASARSSG